MKALSEKNVVVSEKEIIEREQIEVLAYSLSKKIKEAIGVSSYIVLITDKRVVVDSEYIKDIKTHNKIRKLVSTFTNNLFKKIKIKIFNIIITERRVVVDLGGTFIIKKVGEVDK